MTNVKIKAVEIYHPKNSVDNEYFINHFKERGKEINHFLEMMGRKSRYIINNDSENSLTMAIEASRKALIKAGLTGTNIDMIVFSTQTPEYTFPTNAIFVHNAIKGKKRAICQDTNANCAGMLVSVEQTCRYMLSNPDIKYALVVGSDYNSINCNPEDEITYANYGDASSAIILEKTEEKRGFIDCLYYIDSEGCKNIMFPACGLSNIYNPHMKPNDIQIKWTPFDGTCSIASAINDMKYLIEKYNIENDQVGAFCLSQFSENNIDLIQKELNIDKDKFIYVGNEFGYTGTSSPFLALHKGIEAGTIKKDDYIIFWSVGAGWQIITMLFKY